MTDLSARPPSSYSRYLRPLLPARDPDLAGRLARRWSLAALLAGTVGLLAYGTRARWFDPDGPGRAAYWLHDRLYLSAKGYLWSAWFPDSTVPWTVAALLSAIGLAGWLSGRPLLRALHDVLTRRTLAHPVGRPLLDRWHALTVRGALRACHLELVAEQMRADLLDAMDAGPEGPRRDGLSDELCAERLSAIVVLSSSWRLRSDGGEATRLAVAADLLEALLRIAHGVDGTRPGAIDPALDHLSALLEPVLSDLASVPAGDPFAPAALAADAIVLVRASTMRRASGRLADPVTLRPIAASVMERCNRLNAIRFAVERGLGGHGREVAVPSAAAPACGRLALLIAFAMAGESAEFELANSTLDSMSSLDFARNVGLPAPVSAFADMWLAEAPDLPHWRIAARLAQAEPWTGFGCADLTFPADLTHLTEPMHRLVWIAGAPETSE